MRYINRSLRILVLVVFGAWGASATATIIAFSYTGDGTNLGCSICFATGSGSFSFADSPTSVSLGDLTGFTFTQTYTDTSIPASGTYDYGLSDLLSFTATLDSAQNVTDLALVTQYVLASSGPFAAQSFVVASVADADTDQCDPTQKGGFCERQRLTSGAVTTSVIPEPATIYLLIMAAAGIVGHVFRSREGGPA